HLDPREDALVPRAAYLAGEGRRDLGPLELGPAHHLEYRGAHEHLEAHEDADRVPRQTEERLALDEPEPLWHPRLHRHAVEIDVAASEEGGLDHVPLPDRDAAGRHEPVGLDLVIEDRFLERLRVVPDDPRE